MATAAVASQPPMPTGPVAAPSFKPIINNAATKRKLEKAEFDPKKHLAYKEPESILSMENIGYSKDTGVSPMAVSQPFKLFSDECIQKFRDEVLSEETVKNCSRESTLAACQVRGYAPKYAPFIHDAWHSEETLSIISKIAGVDLVPCMDYEVGHVNISVKSGQQAADERAAVEREQKSYAEDEGIAGCPWEDDKPVVGWHNDSYPFVCVTMLSDCTDMVGGETALRKPDGEIMKVRGPQMGCAVVMQGRYITHQALRALGAQERITMVTSFRPKSPFLADDSVLTTVRGISDLSELYYEFGRYRLEIMEERIRAQLKKLRDMHDAGKKTDTKAMKAFFEESERFIRHTNSEMVPEEDVVPGEQPEMDFPDEKLPTPQTESEDEREAKRARTQ
ncbi:hypothetical protein NU219Hw_g2060t1 [Hortaea werneckii]